MKKIMFYLLNWTWGLPQNLAGLAVFLYCKIVKHNPTYMQSNGIALTNWNSAAGLSLGMFVFVDKIASQDTIKHEFGHTLQNLIFGWTWLIFFGLPSLIWAGIYKKRFKHDYYWFYTERFADYLGNVQRG